MRALARVTLSLAVAASCAQSSGTSTAPTPTRSPTSTIETTPEPTKPPGMGGQQQQLPLPTYVRWAIDKGHTDDPQQRSRLVLFSDGQATWRIVDASGTIVVRVPVPGDGIFGAETCMVTERTPQEITAWAAIDAATVDALVRNHASYRAVAEGIPAGEVSLEFAYTGCSRR